jgi:A/G-specific adenine glycosylase
METPRQEEHDHLGDCRTLLREHGFTAPVVTAFRRLIYDHFHRNRREMPWRRTSDPYRILVSEIMLQQTQVQRVETKYREFIAAFPGFPSLARAQLRDVLRVWQGMGYNRRAMALHKIARRVVTEFNGRLPASVETLLTFPGIGAATAGAVVAFVFNKPAVFLETNIRRVFLHLFFANQGNVRDKDLLPLVAETLDRENPRQWYYALMDYGAMLKNAVGNPNRRSAHYSRQSPFEGSDRQIRSLILKTLLAKPRLSLPQLLKTVRKSAERVERIMTQLGEEGFLVREGDLLWISPGQADKGHNGEP